MEKESNRGIIAEAISRYLDGLPEPKTVPHEVRVEIRFEEATEVHVISLDAAAEAQQSAAKAVLQITKLYNEICKDLPKVRTLTAKRRRDVQVRMRRYSSEDFAKVFKKAQESDFLCGRNDRAWTANFDWLMNESNMAKVLEGNYDNKNVKRFGKPQSFDVDEAYAIAMSRSYGR